MLRVLERLGTRYCRPSRRKCSRQVTALVREVESIYEETTKEKNDAASPGTNLVARISTNLAPNPATIRFAREDRDQLRQFAATANATGSQQIEIDCAGLAAECRPLEINYARLTERGPPERAGFCRSTT